MIDYNKLPYSGQINAILDNIPLMTGEQLAVFMRCLQCANSENNGIIMAVKTMAELAQAGISPTDILLGLSKASKQQKARLEQASKQLKAREGAI